jgi:hypothetical protein
MASMSDRQMAEMDLGRLGEQLRADTEGFAMGNA